MIKIEYILPEQMRYKTCGDWLDDGTIQIAQSGNPDYDFAVAVHELVEAHLCKRDGVSQESVDKWDLEHPNADEPGDIPGAPYSKQHFISSAIERVLIVAMGYNWAEYEQVLSDVWGRSGPSSEVPKASG